MDGPASSVVAWVVGEVVVPRREERSDSLSLVGHASGLGRAWKLVVLCALVAMLYPACEAVVRADPLPFGIALKVEHIRRPDKVSGLGAVWARIGVVWSGVEPSNTTPDQYTWTAPDRSIAAVEAVGLNPIVLIYDNPAWAATTTCGPIDLVGMEEFAEFVGALAERYDGDGDYDGDGSLDGEEMPNITHWELYNEPDCHDEVVGDWLGGCWGNHGTEYAQMLAVAWQAMHAANEEVVIVFGSMAAEAYLPWFNFSMEGEDFLDDVLEYIVATPDSYFDWMAFHNYYAFRSRWGTYGPGIIGKAEYLRQRLAGYGLSKPIACTEAGLQSDKQYDGMPFGFEGQSRYLVMAQVRAAAGGIRAVTWYKMKDDPDEAWGLVDEDYLENPSYAAYQTLTRELGTATPRGAAPLGAGLEGYEFQLPGDGTKTVVWSTDGVTRTASFAGPFLRVAEKYGSEVIVADGGYGDADGAANGEVTIEVGGSPLYAEPLPDTGVALYAGWNLISIPVSPASTIVTDVLASIEGKYDLVYAYDGSDQADPWKKYDVAALPFLNDLTEIDETMGLWVRATEVITLRVSGGAPSSADIPLHAGWNLVGCPLAASTPVTETLSSIEGNYDLVYGYDASDQADPWKKYDVAALRFLNDLAYMGPWQGFWIRVDQDCTWSLP